MQNKKRPQRVISDAERQQVATTAPAAAPKHPITVEYLSRQPNIVLTVLVLIMRDVILTRNALYGPLEEAQAMLDDKIRKLVAECMAEMDRPPF